MNLPSGHSSDRLPISIAALLFAAATLITCVVAYPAMFSGFQEYDDEGFMLISLQSFIENGGLYDRVYALYGPFFYQLWGGLFHFIGPVTHDAGRMVTLIVWLASSLAVGIATYRITESAMLGIASQLLACTVLTVLAKEPMHPGGLTTILLALIALVSTRIRHYSPAAIALIGAATAALVLVKINVGLFALAAFLLIAAQTYPILLERRWLRLTTEVGFVSTPAIIMIGTIGEPWAQYYALHALVTALALVVVLRSQGDAPRRPNKELGVFVAVFVAIIALISVGAVAAGTSLSGLYEGVIGQALRHAGVFAVPLQLPRWVFIPDLVALAAAMGYSYARRSGPSDFWRLALALLSIFFGLDQCVAIADWFVLYAGYGMEVPFESHPIALAAFTWLVLVEDRRVDSSNGRYFTLRILAALTVLQVLHAYPVAGSQIGFASFLLVPASLICVGAGLRTLLITGRRTVSLTIAATVSAFALFVPAIALFLLFVESSNKFSGGTSLALYGSQRIHLAPDKAELYQRISTAAKDGCNSIVTQPGMNSFYFWTQIRPPTDQNVTFWARLLPESVQQRILAKLETIEGLCLLRNLPIETKFWAKGKQQPETSLQRFLHESFTPVGLFGDYELLRRTRPAQEGRSPG